MLRFCLIGCLWLLACSVWAVPVKLADAGSVAVYAHPSADVAPIGQLTGGSQVDVIATDSTKGYLLIQYQDQQAWIKASSVMDSATAGHSIQGVVDQALSTAGQKVDAAVSTAQSKLSRGLAKTPLHQQMTMWSNTQVKSLFLTGALILLLGLVIGLLLGKMIWRPKRSFLR